MIEKPQKTLNRVPARIKHGLVLGCLAMAATLASAQTTNIAYRVPAGTEGNQAFGGSLGMDFDVANPIVITKLGVFDDLSDGLKVPITARLFDRATQTELAFIEFTPEDSGTLVNGSRFKALPQPITLDIGFQGTIEAEGYGADERLRNGMNNTNNIVWTTDDGSGSLVFVGLSRWGTAGAFPTTVDEGPAARFAAGTFEYKTTPPLKPGAPKVKTLAGDQQVVLSWDPVTLPMAAATYNVLRAPVGSDNFARIGTTSTTNYTDQPLPNGVEYRYQVQGVSSTGKVGVNSATVNSAAFKVADGRYIAYQVEAGWVGNQAFSGSLGMDFNVVNTIIVTRLGVYDDGTDGLKLPITARLWDRATQAEVASVEFTAENPGTLIRGSRFKDLTAPVKLEAGFQGIIAAEGYGADEKVFNSGGKTNQMPWVLETGNGSLLFTGSSRYGVIAGVFPEGLDGGPAARYAAGTFEYETTPPALPGTPIVSINQISQDQKATLTWLAVTNPLPAAKYQVFRTGDTNLDFVKIAEVAELQYTDTGLTNGITVYYQVRAVSAGNTNGNFSAMVFTTPAKRAGGIAYQTPAGQPGNQAFGGSLGMDFDVYFPIKVTKLGVFDENSDGLNLTINAALFDRTTTKSLVKLEFTTAEPGELIGGSRFKTLATPIILPAGFKGCMVAWGYGTGEQLFNTGGTAANVALLQNFDGASIMFVGTSRYSVTPGNYPESADGGPAARYAAGTFAFEVASEPPKLSATLASGKLVITWAGGGVLQKTTDIAGSWTDTDLQSGAAIPVAGDRAFYRVKQ